MNVIQSISTAARAIEGAAGSPSRPADAVAQPAAQSPASFMQRMAMAGGETALLPDADLVSQTGPVVPTELAAGAAAEAERDFEGTTEPVAEQWLQSMLAQHQALVQARDGEPAAAPAVAAPVEDEPPAEALAILAQPSAGAGLAPAEALQPADLQAFATAIARSAAPAAGGREAGLPLLGAGEAPSAEALLAGLDLPDARAPDDAAGALSQPAAPTFERVLKLQAPEAKWGEQMLQALRDNVELQLQQRVQSATIRLDPPELGSLEILVSHESGRLSVQVHAAQPEVARLLQQTSERLRQELVGQHFVQVNVQVGADGGQGQSERQPRLRLPAEDAPVAFNEAPSDEPSATGGRRGDVLVTV